jgi:ATP-dependent DNA ligase
LPDYLDYPIEGYVFKNGNILDYAKWKPVRTIDLIVSGTTKGQGKYKGMVGALRACTTEGFEVAKVSGMDDATRASIDNGTFGRIIEVAYQGVGAKGRLRHPRFIRWREDKLSDGCKVSQDPELERIWRDKDT